MKIVILGWGSLLWDKRDEFDEQHSDWRFDGPKLKVEFSRISQTRNGALTLVLDYVNGTYCQVAYAFSRRKNPDDAIFDLRSREGTILNNIGCYFAHESRTKFKDEDAFNDIKNWATERKFDVVIWTDLGSNFKDKTGNSFSQRSAMIYLQGLSSESRDRAVEYVWHAPKFINTPLRQAVQAQPWYQELNLGETQDD